MHSTAEIINRQDLKRKNSCKVLVKTQHGMTLRMPTNKKKQQKIIYKL